jgi:hypothetical protein
MTRRDVTRIGLALPGWAALQAWAATSKEFWNNKPPSDWAKSEIQDLLNRSPWAKEVNLSENGHGLDVGSGGGPGGYGNLPGGGVGRQQFAPPAGQGRFRATVRWDSALPIREAMHLKPSKDSEQNYIIAVTGDLPDVGQIVGANEGTRDEQRMEDLKQYTKLERKGEPMLLSRMAATPSDYPSGGGTLFYFGRRDAILAEDKQVTFVTRVGPYEVKARFNLKEMLYHGKLEI